MRKLFILLTVAGTMSLVACTAPVQKRDTYNQINNEMKQALVSDQKPVSPEMNAAVEAALLPPISIELPKPQRPADERFNLNFDNVPAPQFFMAIALDTPYNMLVHPDVTGTISAHLKNVTLFEVLDAIRELYGYDYKVDGTRISIRPLTMQTRVFQVNYLTGTRNGTSDTRVISNSASTRNGSSSSGGNSSTQSGQGGSVSQIDSAKISTINNSDFWRDLRTALDAIVGVTDGRSVVISPQSGVVVIRAMPDELNNVASYLKASQLSVDRQVILEAKILEVQLNSSFQSGINWAAFGSRIGGGFVQPGTTLNALPATGATAATALSTAGNASLNSLTGSALAAAATNSGSVFGLALQTSNFSSLISFLESQGAVHVLSSPRIATLNNQKAVLKVGTDDFFVTGVSTTTTTGSAANTTTPNVTLEPFFSGVVLDVMPQIDADGNIILHVHPAVTQVTSVSQTINLGTAGTLVLPLASSATQETDSIVRGQDGHIVAIGGLMRQSTSVTDNKVPGAADVPVAGNLFKNTDQASKKSELVILIKPIVVKGDSGWERNILDSQKRILQLDPGGAGAQR